jgi:phosphoglycolate phosphatase
MKKAILFDLDGTILDTIKDIHQAVNVGLKTYGYNNVTVDQVKRSVGSGAMQMIALCAPSAHQEMVKKIHDAYQTAYDKNHKDLTMIYEGILPLLNQLKKKYQLAVVSNKYDYLVKSLIQHYFPNIFDAALGMTKNLPIKPEPDMVLKVCKDLNVTPHEVIYIGDSEPDIIVSKRIGMDHIAVSYGYRDNELLKALQPMHLVKDVESLKKLLLLSI